MKRIKSIYVLLVLILPILFSSCDPEESFEPKFEDGIPPTGLYVKAKIGDVVWQGNLVQGRFFIPMRPGVYFLRVNNKSYKVICR